MANGKKAPRKAKELAISERTIQAIDLAKHGYSYQAIAQALGVSSETARLELVHTVQALSEFRQEIGAGYVSVQLSALDELIVNYHERALSGDKDIGALYLKALGQRAKLLGLDAHSDESKSSAPIVLGWQGPGTLTMRKGDTQVSISGMESAVQNSTTSEDAVITGQQEHRPQSSTRVDNDHRPEVITGQAHPAGDTLADDTGQ
jgi:hypothetical protein